MPLSLTFHQTNSQADNGVLLGTLPMVATQGFSGVISLPVPTVIHYNATTNATTISDVSLAANDVGTLINLFDSTLPGQDALYIDAYVMDDRVNGLRFEVVNPAVGLSPSNAPIVIDYWYNGVRTPVTGITATSDIFTTAGIKTISFDVLPDFPAWPVGEFSGKFVRVRIPTLTSCTTPATIDRIWTSVESSARKYTDISSLLATSDNKDFRSYMNTTISPQIGDVIWYAVSDNKFCQVPMTVYRPRSIHSANLEHVYWNGTEVTAINPTYVQDSGNNADRALMNTSYAPGWSLTSTSSATAWGVSGIVANQILTGNGHVGFYTNLSGTGKFGFSFGTADTLAFADAKYAVVVDSATSLVSVYTDGEVKGSFPVLTNQSIKIERVEGYLRVFINETFRYMFTTATTAPLYIYTFYQSLGAATKFHLCTLANDGLNTNIPLTWGTASAVTTTEVADAIELFEKTVFKIAFVPPADWAKHTLKDVTGATHEAYMVGVRFTTSATTPYLPALYTTQAILTKDTNSGIKMTTAQRINGLSFYIDKGIPPVEASMWVLVNTTTGESVGFIHPPDSKIGNHPAGLTINANDYITIVSQTNLVGQFPEALTFILMNNYL